MNCPACGASNPDGAAWCNQCLKQLSAQPESPPGAEPAPQVANEASHPPSPVNQPQAIQAPGAYPASQYGAPGAPGMPDAPGPAAAKKGPPVLLMAAIAVLLVVVVAGVAIYFASGAGSSKAYRDGDVTFSVTKFECGVEGRQVIEGPQGPVVHPRDNFALGRFCILEATIESKGASAVFESTAQELVDSSGNSLDFSSVLIETITPPGNFYRPGTDPTISPDKKVDARIIWDYDPAVTPASAILHLPADSPGVTVPVK